MQKKRDQYYYSPSDLTRFMESPFASWMDRYALDFPEVKTHKDPQDELMAILAQKGYAHEDNLEEEFRLSGRTVVKIEKGSLSELYERTIEAMHDGAEVIVQGRLELGVFGGYSDFLIKVPGESKLGNYHYEIWDTKLATKVKPYFLVQLCCYAEMLEAIQGVSPQYLTVALGNGQKERFRTSEYYYYYASLKQAFLQAQKAFDPTKKPDPANSNSWGDWSQHAQALLLEADHLSEVATITKGQIKKLNDAGIYTLEALGTCDASHVKGMNDEIFVRLKAQARIQLQTRQQHSSPNNTSIKPCFDIIKPQQGEKLGLALLPPASPLDIFFDIEGYPLADGGLEYLWGSTYFDDTGERAFIDFWAHNPEQEKQAFTAFIQWAYQRWLQDPSMHIYHYANYEIAACKKLMGRYGVCEYEVDQLLRNEVFVDLYKVVKGSVLLGEPRYSIKNVEHLYRAQRETEVSNGGDSVVAYEQWMERHQRGEQGDTWQTSEILRNIRHYNIDDCDSTQELVDWLREQQQQHQIQYIGIGEELIEPEISEQVTETTRLRDELLQKAQNAEHNFNAELLENLAWLLEFHRRETKPVFWKMFERLGLSHVDLIDDLDCLACCSRTERDPFKPTARARNLAYEYQFDPEQEFKGTAQNFYLLGIENESGSHAKAKYLKDESDLENGYIVLQSAEALPEIVSLIPDEYVSPDPIPQALLSSVRDCDIQTPDSYSAIVSFLTRSRPHFKPDFTLFEGHKIAPAIDSGEKLKQIIAAILNLESSYLTLQGPPGAGKSYTGKHVITELVKAGKRVGITSNSHKAINNLLISTAKNCIEQGVQAHIVCTKDTEEGIDELGISVLKNNQLSDHTQTGCVIGTTAWGFAREDMAQQLDYLFVDEAGQVSVANLVAMSRATDNIVLMGDQMQLGQPTQGTHPLDSGLSVLDYLLKDSPTISDDMGVFLGTTYRMHSNVNQFISRHIYDGKLGSHPSTDQRFIERPDAPGVISKEAGIVFVSVEHQGNSQASDEEVEAIQSLAQSLLGRTFHTGDKAHPTRPIGWDDMLFVAPYNHQVSKLKQALGQQAKVGSVDKFQGQEAPIVFLSMCASDPNESPRGLDFLFDKNRINVAISRAQCLAIVVANPKIGQIQASSTKQLRLTNLFNALCYE